MARHLLSRWLTARRRPETIPPAVTEPSAPAGWIGHVQQALAAAKADGSVAGDPVLAPNPTGPFETAGSGGRRP